MSESHVREPSGRFAELPRALQATVRVERLAANRTPYKDGGIPALLAHPDDGWLEPGATPRPAPTVLWMHGRTVRKEIDPGRYLRWKKLGIATCAIDMPAHGERANNQQNTSVYSLPMAEQAAHEVDLVVDALADPHFKGAFDLNRLAIGGMSLGGMATLIRLCNIVGGGHNFRCAILEATTGDLDSVGARAKYSDEMVERLSPINHLDMWTLPIPILAVHSKLDEWVPIAGQRRFFEALRTRYAELSADPGMLQLHEWPSTGAEAEHMGFGRRTNDTKNMENEFLQRWLFA
ncbi:MAG: prolyl oligopeptidase family serine peptidase [Phycisphaerales bacterium]|nr:prolyl oligopeptidase family serine peptidase [Phycisphaerales bacterium]